MKIGVIGPKAIDEFQVPTYMRSAKNAQNDFIGAVWPCRLQG